MTISILELSRAIKKDLSLEKYIVLRIAEDGVFYLFPPTHFPNTISELKTNGYLNGDNSLTIKGKALLKEIQEKEVVKTGEKGNNQLYITIQEELVKLVGKKQVVSKIKGVSYSFLPNFTDFQTKIEKAVKKYRLNDKNKLESVILNYIRKCHRENHWFPVLSYYILKDNFSKLADDYDTFDGEEKSEIVKQVNKGTIDI